MIAQWIKKVIREWFLRKRFRQSVIYSGAIVDSCSTMEPYSVLFKNSTLLASTLGRYSYVQANSVICNAQIGAFCSIAGNVNIGLAKHPTNMVSNNPVLSDYGIGVLPKTIIGEDVWIGQVVVGTMISKNVAPYSYCSGHTSA